MSDRRQSACSLSAWATSAGRRRPRRVPQARPGRRLDEREIDSAGTRLSSVSSRIGARRQPPSAAGVAVRYSCAKVARTTTRASTSARDGPSESAHADRRRLQRHAERVSLFLNSCGRESEVPDPYYGGSAGFEHVLDLVEDASRGLLRPSLKAFDRRPAAGWPATSS